MHHGEHGICQNLPMFCDRPAIEWISMGVISMEKELTSGVESQNEDETMHVQYSGYDASVNMCRLRSASKRGKGRVKKQKIRFW